MEKTTDIFVTRPLNEEQTDFIVTVGKGLATPKHFQSREEAEEFIRSLENTNWEVVIAVVAEMLETIKKEKK